MKDANEYMDEGIGYLAKAHSCFIMAEALSKDYDRNDYTDERRPLYEKAQKLHDATLDLINMEAE